MPQSEPPTLSEILELCPGVDAIIWSTRGMSASEKRLTKEVLDAAGDSLRAISTVSAGLDHVELAEIRRRNILLGHTPDVLNAAVADIALGLLISAARRFHEGRINIEKYLLLFR